MISIKHLLQEITERPGAWACRSLLAATFGAVAGKAGASYSWLQWALWGLAAAFFIGFVILFVVFLGRRKIERETKLRAAKNAEEFIKTSVVAKFDEGYKYFEDPHLMPWYLLIGEPGSGKTEACERLKGLIPRGAEVKLADQQKGKGITGKGGTAGMDWQFYRHIVILDTAGGLTGIDAEKMDATDPRKFVNTTSQDWKLLLQKIEKARPKCPLNGVILVLPADSLANDGPSTTDQKANNLKDRLDELGTNLHLRLPIYFLITKCDKIPGFRENFKHLGHEDSRQIVGWSKPIFDSHPGRAIDSREATSGLKALAQRLVATRPVAEHEPDNKAELEKAAYRYTFPYALLFPGEEIKGFPIYGNLMSYIAKICDSQQAAEQPANETDTAQVQGFRPELFEAVNNQHFYRGIYFSSAKQTESLLNPDMAKVIDVSVVERMSALGKDSCGERGFFLADLVTKKILPEKDLVQRLPDYALKARKKEWEERDKRWKRGVIAWGLFALGFLGLWFLTGIKDLRDSVGAEFKTWQAATNFAVSTPKEWLETVTTASFGKRHLELAERVQKPMDIPLLYRLIERLFQNLAGSIADKRLPTQRKLFQDQVVVPSIRYTLAKLTSQVSTKGAMDAAALNRYKAALHAWLQLEADVIDSRSIQTNNADPKFLNACISYLSDSDSTASFPDLQRAFQLTCVNRGYWNLTLPETLSGDQNREEGIEAAVSYFAASARITDKQTGEELKALTSFQALLETYYDKEQELAKSAVTRTDQDVDSIMNRLLGKGRELEDFLSTNQCLRTYVTNNSLTDGFLMFSQRAAKSSEDPVQSLFGPMLQRRSDPLFIKTMDILSHARAARVGLNVRNQDEILREKLDNYLLKPYPSSKVPAFLNRLRVYTEVQQFRKAPHSAELGSIHATLKGLDSQGADLVRPAINPAYGEGSAFFGNTVTGLVKQAVIELQQQVASDYLKAVAEALARVTQKSNLSLSQLANYARLFLQDISGLQNDYVDFQTYGGEISSFSGTRIFSEQFRQTFTNNPKLLAATAVREFDAVLRASLREQLLFPVVQYRTNSHAATADEVRIQLKALEALYKVLDGHPALKTPEFVSLQPLIAQLAKAGSPTNSLTLLLTSSSKCNVFLAASQPPGGCVLRMRYVKMEASPKGDWLQWFENLPDAGRKLGEVSIGDQLKCEVSADSKAWIPLESGKWGPLELLQRNGQPGGTEARRFTVVWDTSHGPIRLEFDYKEPVPALDNWPSF